MSASVMTTLFSCCPSIYLYIPPSHSVPRSVPPPPAVSGTPSLPLLLFITLSRFLSLRPHPSFPSPWVRHWALLFPTFSRSTSPPLAPSLLVSEEDRHLWQKVSKRFKTRQIKQGNFNTVHSPIKPAYVWKNWLDRYKTFCSPVYGLDSDRGI